MKKLRQKVKNLETASGKYFDVKRKRGKGFKLKQ
jgi:hypothetical protein